ncbi:MAG: diacylglycerol kinase family protein [Firmicutes bacterium]|nr:diacylglycerol kinase family protein [Bacillota bacterium]
MDKVWLSLKNAFLGLKYCFMTQRNMIIHVVIGIIVMFFGFWLKVSKYDLLFLLAAVLMVLVAEAFNTALENTIDLYTSERNRLARIAKDVAAGAVLLTSVFAVIVGLIIFGPPLWHLVISYLVSANF